NFQPRKYKVGNQDFELWLRNLLYPKIHFDIHEFQYQGKAVVIFRIAAAKSEPVNFQKKPFIRINSNKTDLRNHPNYVRQIYNTQEDWSMKVVESASLADLDEDALLVATQKFKGKSINEKFYKEIDSWDPLTLLDKAKITINGKITNTALLLLGKPESSHYILPYISEITWKLDTEQKAYEHFGMPLLTNTSKVLERIRNYQYKFFPNNELLAVSVNKYETRVILEALNNAIAHQDYALNARIIVTEKSEKLVFQNSGSFFSGTPDEYVLGDKTPDRYRNPWLAKAMVNLGMIDTMGYGIHTMFIEQRKRFFPLPDYSKSTDDKVILEIYGQEIDVNYSKLLMEKKDLDLGTVILLDRVQKNMNITKDALTLLRKQKLIEGRSPNIYVSASVAKATGNLDTYIKYKSFDDRYFKDMIIEFISKNGEASKSDIDNLILDKLPSLLDEKQKKNKVRNLIYALSKREKEIVNCGTRRYPIWKFPKD
ncbi:MAG: ATP-binding protein, partial [Bacteroidales bacterium]|nr:ATP-binding protein [Bacteroidales bacterium]